LKKVESLALISKNALAIHDMICHEYGTQMVISFHLEIPSQLKLSEAHTIADKIEFNIFNELKIKATVHLDPVLPEIKNRSQLTQIISSYISKSDNLLDHKALRLIGEESHATLVMDIITNNFPTDDEIEEINKGLKEKLSDHIPNIKDMRINYIKN
jgi:hypothetical protein